MKPTARFSVGVGNIKTSTVNTINFSPRTSSSFARTWSMTYKNQRKAILYVSVIKRHTFRYDELVARAVIPISSINPNSTSDIKVNLCNAFKQVIGSAASALEIARSSAQFF